MQRLRGTAGWSYQNGGQAVETSLLLPRIRLQGLFCGERHTTASSARRDRYQIL